MKKRYCLAILFFWLILAGIEILAPFFIDKRFFFFRTWEYVANDDSLNVGIIPFKPLQNAALPSEQDLAHPLFFDTKNNEKRKLQFVTDEYGFRNQPYLLKNQQANVVLFGTSQVAGASETQNNLVSEILKKKYGITAYTYAKAQLQQFWEDTRFKKNPPKYVVILGQDYEFTSKPYMIRLANANIDFSMTAWTKQAWYVQHAAKEDRLLHRDYVHTSDYEKRYSLLRVFSDFLFRKIVSKIFDKTALTNIFGNRALLYEQKSDMVFLLSQLENPTLVSYFKTSKDVSQTVATLKATQDILQTRGITLIVGIMPSKSYLYSTQYKNVPREKTAIVALERELDDAKIDRIPLFDAMYQYAHTTHNLLYYRYDTHWNNNANEIIAGLLSEKLKRNQQ